MLKNNSRIDYIYFSNTAPINKNVLWLTFVDSKFILKIYNNGEWQDITNSFKEVKVTIDNLVSSNPKGFGSINNGILSLQLSGIKGEKGDSIIGPLGILGAIGPLGPLGVKGDKGDKGGPFIYSDFTQEQLEALKVKGDQGEKGEKGDIGPQGPLGATSVYDQTTQDFLTTLETTTGDSQTKTMTQKAITEELMKDRVWGNEEINFSSYTLRTHYINSDTTSTAYGKWKSGGAASNSCWVIPVTPGSIIKVVPTATSRYDFAFLRTYNYGNNVVVDFCGGAAPSSMRYTETMNFVVPEDAAYMYVTKMYGSTNRSPQSISKVIYTKDYIGKIGVLETQIDELDDALTLQSNELEDKITQSSIHRIAEISIPSTKKGTYLYYIDLNGLWHSNNSDYSGICMEVEPGVTYCVVPQSGYKVRYAWLTSEPSSKETGDTPPYATGCVIVLGNTDETLYITAPEDAHYLYLHRKGYSAPKPLSFGEVITVNGALTELEGGASTIDKDTFALIKHAVYKKSGSDSADSLPYFNIIHYSDIHGSQLAAGKILNARNALLPYINDVVNSGDVINAVVGGNYGGEDYYPNSGLQEVSLFTLGNHDDLISTSTGERKDKAWSHALYFPEEVITALGVTMPTGYDDSTSPNYNACYWHKDYADQKVRIIGLDCRNKFDGEVDPATGGIVSAGTNYTTNELEVWLIDKLNETLESSSSTAAGYSVIIVGHYPLDNYNGDNIEWNDSAHKWVCNYKSTGGRVISQKTSEVTNWHRYTSTSMTAAASMRWSNASGVNNIAEIIKHYMEQEGSNFVAFLCGHTHNNLFFYPTNYPDILNICIDMAGGLRDMNYADQDTMGGYIANFISFATSSKIVRIVRLGVKSDTLLTPINYMCYNYALRKVVQEG